MLKGGIDLQYFGRALVSHQEGYELYLCEEGPLAEDALGEPHNLSG